MVSTPYSERTCVSCPSLRVPKILKLAFRVQGLEGSVCVCVCVSE